MAHVAEAVVVPLATLRRMVACEYPEPTPEQIENSRKLKRAMYRLLPGVMAVFADGLRSENESTRIDTAKFLATKLWRKAFADAEAANRAQLSVDLSMDPGTAAALLNAVLPRVQLPEPPAPQVENGNGDA